LTGSAACSSRSSRRARPWWRGRRTATGETVKKHAETAQWVGDAKVGEIDCKKLSFTPSEESMKEVIKGFGLPDMGIDWKKTTLVCVGFVSKEDLMLRKFDINAEIVVSYAPPEEDGETPTEGGDDFTATWKATITIDISDFNKDLDVKVPDAAAKALEEPAK
jgi:hypothetical protein